MKTILITGGAGFIGSHLCENFLNKDFLVVCVDNFLTGSSENIKHLARNKNFIFLEQNVSNGIHYEGGVDYVMHFASPASPIDYLELPIETLKVGAHGTLNALGLAKKKGSTFLLASTSEVYGDPLVHPQKEDYWGNVNPIGPRGVYDEAKRYAEAMTMAYHRTHRINTRIVRIFNTYGPRMRLNDGRAVPAFIGAAFKNEAIPVFGDGSQTRSFCYISDLVRGLEALLMSDYNNPVNIGNPAEMSILEMANKIIELTGSKSKIKFEKLPEDDPKVRKPDISRAKELLNWAPLVQLDEGLKETINYFKEKQNR
jgi:dTDP-glucose 4,6-dehydratase